MSVKKNNRDEDNLSKIVKATNIADVVIAWFGVIILAFGIFLIVLVSIDAHYKDNDDVISNDTPCETTEPYVETTVMETSYEVETTEVETTEVVTTEVKVYEPYTYNQYIDMELTTPSYLTAEQIDYALKDTALSGLGEAFVRAEQTYGVNAQYLVAHAAWESGWGKSSLAQKNNNLFGFGAYDYLNGDVSKMTKFASKEECIMFVAEYIYREYLSEDGTYYNGNNLQGVNVRWAGDTSWYRGIADVMTCIDGRISNMTS